MSVFMRESIPFYTFAGVSKDKPTREVRTIVSEDLSDHAFMQKHLPEAYRCAELWQSRGLVPLNGKKRVEFFALSHEIREYAQGCDADARRAIICGVVIDRMRCLGLSLRQAYLAHDVHEYRLVFQED